MNDFDIKGIEKYRKQLKKGERADSSQRGRQHQERAYDDRRLSFERRVKDEPLSFSGSRAAELRVAEFLTVKNSDIAGNSAGQSPERSAHKEAIEEQALQAAPPLPLSTGAEQGNSFSFGTGVSPIEGAVSEELAISSAEMESPTHEEKKYADFSAERNPSPKTAGIPIASAPAIEGKGVEIESESAVSDIVAESDTSDIERPASEDTAVPAVEILEFDFDEDYPTDEIYGSASFEDAVVSEATAAGKAEQKTERAPIAERVAAKEEKNIPLAVNDPDSFEQIVEETSAVADKAGQVPAARRPRWIVAILSLFKGKSKTATSVEDLSSVSEESGTIGIAAAAVAESVEQTTALSDNAIETEVAEETGVVAAVALENMDEISVCLDDERRESAAVVIALLPEISSFDRTEISDGIVFGEGVALSGTKESSEETIAAVSTENTDQIVEKVWFSKALEKVLVPRFYAVLVLMFLLLGPLFTLKYYGEFCYLSDEGEETPVQKVVWTAANSPREIAEEVVELKEADKVEVEEFGSTKMLTVVRSYPVTLTVDGATETHHVLDHSVADLLGGLGVSLSEDDLLSHDHGHILNEGDEIVVQRVTYEQREAVEDVPYKTVMKNSPVLREGNENLAQTGIDGVAARVYRDRYVDGELVSSEIVEEEIIEKGRDEIIVTGDPTVPASTIDGSLYTDIEIVDGVPADYEWAIEGAVCTAYSGKPGTFGASGMRLFQGFVAVNPDVIPYGTLMYIASDRFTYGWAIAGDCGTAMMEGYVDIDCYFETYNESAMFGKKALNVYVVKQLTQSELEEYAANGMFYGRVPVSASNGG